MATEGAAGFWKTLQMRQRSKNHGMLAAIPQDSQDSMVVHPLDGGFHDINQVLL